MSQFGSEPLIAKYQDMQIIITPEMEKQLNPLQKMLKENIEEISQKPTFMLIQADPKALIKYPEFLDAFSIHPAQLLFTAFLQEQFQILAVGFESKEGEYLAVPFCKLVEAGENQNLLNTRKDPIQEVGVRRRVKEMKNTAEKSSVITGKTGFNVQIVP